MDSRESDVKQITKLLSEALEWLPNVYKVVHALSDHRLHKDDKGIPHVQNILKFKSKEGCLKPLQQSCLLKGTKLWIENELTPTHPRWTLEEGQRA